MAYDETLATRIRAILADAADCSERKMFGGLAFMISGNMACGIVGNDLMLRLGEAGADAALDKPHTRPMDFTGRPMRSMLYVTAEGVRDDDALADWVNQGVAFARSLP